MALVVTPATVRTGVQEKPSADVGTMTMDSPRCRSASGSVRQASQNVVGVLDQAGPHLLPVDHVLVPVPHGHRPQSRQVGAGLRLGIPDREVELARGDPGQVERLLLGRPVPHDRRPHRVDGQERHRHPGDRRLVGEDELVEHCPAAPAVLGRPAERQPAVATELPNDLAIRLPVPEALVPSRQRRAHLGGHQPGEVRAQLLPQPFLLRGVGDAHAGPLN